jgi:4-amino-4-deoxy-L-arabinose transferase-like glycosyltransferase
LSAVQPKAHSSSPGSGAVADLAPANSAFPGDAIGLVTVTAFAAIIFFFNLGTYGLWEPDEARYAEIAREMLALHDFIVPHLNYVPYIEKPPLLYWLGAASMSLFGVNEFAARLPNAIAALIGVIATYLFVLRAFDRRRAILAGVILATSGLYAVMAQVLTTDMLLTAMVTVALFAVYLHWREGGRWCWLAYAAIGLAILTKGPVGAVIPFIAGVIFLWWEGQLRGSIRRFHAFAGLLVVAAIALPWFVAITMREPGFFQFYFVGEHFRRFFEPSYSHSGPIYYYAPVIAAGLLPWTIVVPFLPWRSLEPNSARRFCVVSSAVVIGFFSLASSKLIPYILPALPPIAVIIADAIMAFARDPSDADEARHEVADPRRLAALGPILGIAAVAVIVTAIDADSYASRYPLILRPALWLAGASMAVAGPGCFIAFWRRRLLQGLTIFVLGTFAALMAVGYGRILAEPTRSYAQLARDINLRAPNAVLVCYPRYIQSLPFYCRRRVILVGAKTELAYGAEHAPDAARYFFTRRADLMRLWNEPRPTVLIVDWSALTPLQPSLGRYRIIAVDSKKIAIMPIRGENDGRSTAN